MECFTWNALHLGYDEEKRNALHRMERNALHKMLYTWVTEDGLFVAISVEVIAIGISFI